MEIPIEDTIGDLANLERRCGLSDTPIMTAVCIGGSSHRSWRMLAPTR
jgi:hypothetical protein